MAVAWHSLKEEKVLKKLDSSPRGLSSTEATRRLQKFGYNELVERERVTPLQIFLNQFKDIFVIILLIAIFLCVIVGEGIDAITIGAIVILNAIVGFSQEYKSEKAMEAMKKLTAPRARVVRDGKETVIPAREVVPGDIVVLEAGDRVPADGRLLEVAELKTNEAVLTGESTPVGKTLTVLRPETPLADRKNMVFMGTYVTYGRGKAVITSTGMETEFGKIAEMVQAVKEEEPPLKIKLAKFAKKLGKIIVAICALIFVIEFFRDFLFHGFSLQTLADAFLISIALAVSAVPEGLPAITTVTLALGARELAKRNALIRRLASVETLGSTTVICSDKTGTLTKGEMTVRKIYVGNTTIEVSGTGYESKGEFCKNGEKIDPKTHQELESVLKIGALCNNSGYDGKNITGDPTEAALLVVAAKAGMWREQLEKEYPRIKEFPFSSERKRMTTIHKTPEGGIVALTKGAPEVVLERCAYIVEDGEIKKLTARKKKRILETNEKMASDALRVLGMAFKEVPEDFDKLSDIEVESNLIFVGLVGMIDPPREEVKEAVRKCEEAGIKTVMITGDHKLTAVAIAKEIGMLKSSLVLTGSELDAMSDQEFEKIVEKVDVYARVSPEHKIRIVSALKKKGHIVAMTGDGVNDAPAVKNADIGIAMGITGTDVTREAADMVLGDDNFATIVNAVEGGRTIYDNIRKFVFFLIRCNFDELAVIATFAFIFGAELLPLTAPMILWINLVTDGGPALALSMDPPVEDPMKKPPRNPKEGILHGRLFAIIVSFIMQYLGSSLIFLGAYFWAGLPLEKARTMTFMQASLRELVIVWNCRSEKKNAFEVGFFSNKYLFVAVLASVVLTVSLCYVPLLQVMFETTPLTLYEWIPVIGVALSGLLLMPKWLYGRKVWRWT